MNEWSDTLSTLRYAIEVAANDSSAFSQAEYGKSLAELEALEAQVAEKDKRIAEPEAGQQAAIDGAIDATLDKVLDHIVSRSTNQSADMILDALPSTIFHLRGTNPLAELQAKVRELEAENAELRADAERLSCLMNESGRFYEQGLSYQMTGRLREYIDAAMRQRAEQQDGRG